MESVRQAFTVALESLVDRIKEDSTVLAAILCGSLSHDTVWAKSDIDLLLVTIDDRKGERTDVDLYADGVNVHALLVPRGAFRKMVEGSIRHSFMHSFLAKGRLLYTRDESIARLLATLQDLGARDTQVQLLQAATCALSPIYKARKWFVTRGDLDYTALWILYAATPLAQVEVIGAGVLVDREVIPQALALNPAFFTTIYTNLLNARKTAAMVRAALDAIDAYMARRAASLFAPLIEHLREVGEARSSTEIERHFSRHFDVDGVTAACEYLADLGLVGKASTPVYLTRKSHVELQETAFFSLSDDQTT